jgi:hypothetical protein
MGQISEPRIEGKWIVRAGPETAEEIDEHDVKKRLYI